MKAKTLADITTSAAVRPRLPMSDSEILSNYNSAKDKRAQIGILADLNVTNRNMICTILIENGCILNDKPDADKTVAAPSRESRHLQKWTPAEDAELLRMRQAGKSYAEISDKLGRTVNTVRWRDGALKAKQAGEAKPARQKAATANTDLDATLSQPAAVPPAPAPDKSLSTPPDILPRVRYALTLCCDASNAFGNDHAFWGAIALGELKQILRALKCDLEKEESR